MHKVKYIHILYRNEVKFNGKVIAMINNLNLGFDPSEHLFVSMNRDIFQKLNMFSNVIIDESGENLINKYGKKCDWIIAHSFSSIKDLLFAKDKYLSKTIFRYWGGGINGYTLRENEYFRNLVKRTINALYLRKLSKLKVIGIANSVDSIDINRFLQGIPLMRMPYVVPEDCACLENVKENMVPHDIGKDGINIIIGHRGGSEGNHIEIMKLLERYSEHKMNIYLPLSYGDSEYIRNVLGFIETVNYCSIIPITEFVPYNEYIALLSKMDIAIFDGINSYALGNISVLLYLEKIIFLNRNGIIAEAFEQEGVPFRKVDEINEIPFLNFISPVNYELGVGDDLKAHGIVFHTEQWKKLFKYLEGQNE